MALEISKILTLSTAHISKETRALLNFAFHSSDTNLVVYQKNDYGWFVYLTVNPDREYQNNMMPQDLYNCIKLAQHLNCDIICFDRDAEPLPYLKQY